MFAPLTLGGESLLRGNSTWVNVVIGGIGGVVQAWVHYHLEVIMLNTIGTRNSIHLCCGQLWV